ncbi:hypothetical protein [Methylobacterium nigriterrae]|uniref:hypothetical protein n=1 Tax=Methylobacterium nigriterrae TaxID=3127512 RepID=UPI00301320E5
MLLRVCCPIAVWVAFATLVGHHRAAVLGDDPALRTGIEVDLASRYCADTRIDFGRFKDFSQAHGMSHSDLFQRERSAHLRDDIVRLERRLRKEPGPECGRLLETYGSKGREPSLLLRI